MKAAHVRIVDYGDDFAWNYNHHQYRGGFGNQRTVAPVDVDGDGAKDDAIGIWPFSMDDPLNPLPPHWDENAASWRFYGGFTGFFCNTRASHFTEMSTNVDHPGDNINIMVTAFNEPYRCYGVWMWKKEDFLNGGAAHRVTFDAQSKFGLHIGRYWVDADEGRYVVQDGNDFYISEHVYTGDCYEGKARGSGITHLMHPLETRWASYEPTEDSVVFDGSEATYNEHEFKDVQAVGYYAAKTKFGKGSTWIKQYAFEVYANVHRPERPSELVDMIRVEPAAAEDIPPFYISTCEIPYTAWRKIWRWAVSPMFAFDWNYVMDRDGDMGSMDCPGQVEREYSPDEPATDMTREDAAAWCNALSEYEGKEPVYYTEPGFTNVFRKVRERWFGRDRFLAYRPEMHVKWQADGYRLPTREEKEGAPESGPEWVWGEDTSSEAMCLTGFRVVRRDADPGLPVHISLAPEREAVPLRGRDGTERSPAPGRQSSPGVAPDVPVLEMVTIPAGSYPHRLGFDVTISALDMGRHEVTFATWRTVRDWAEEKGYAFNYDGDMGSMGFQTGNHARSPDEPVTRISLYDCLVWCNALSELEGRTPAYYRDKDCTEVLREALPYREAMTFNGPWGGGVTDAIAREPVQVNWAVDGYRLPTAAEWEYACAAGSTTMYYWGDNPDDRYFWSRDNANGRTHPVGEKLPNAFGLCDMSGNVFERCWDDGSGGDDFFAMRRNPKLSGFGGRTQVKGGSFRYPCTGQYARYFTARHQDRGDAPDYAYPEIGFRVVCCNAGTHPKDGVEREDTVFLDVDTTQTPDLLPGATYRWDLARSGVFPVTGVRDLKGVRWAFETGGAIMSSPVAHGGKVYVGSDDGFFYAVDEKTGKQAWRFGIGKPVRSSATIADGVVYFGAENGRLYAVDAGTGDEKWAFTVRGSKSVAGCPVVAYGAVFAFMSGYGTDTGLVAVDPTTGEQICKYFRAGSPGDSHAYTLYSGQLLYAGIGNARGMGSRGTALDLRTGRKQSLRVDRAGGTVVARDGTCYAVGMGLSATDILSGKDKAIMWVEGKGWKDGETYAGASFSSVVLWENKLLFGNETGHFYAHNAPDLSREWSADVGGKVRASPAVAAGVVYFGCMDARLYALDARTGKTLWTIEVGGPVEASSPWPGNGVIYVGSNDGRLYAIE